MMRHQIDEVGRQRRSPIEAMNSVRSAPPSSVEGAAAPGEGCAGKLYQIDAHEQRRAIVERRGATSSILGHEQRRSRPAVQLDHLLDAHG